MTTRQSTKPALDLGLSVEELREQVIERAAERLIASFDASHYTAVSSVVSDAAKKAMVKYGDEVILPIIRERIESLTMQKTNEWGEPKEGGTLTFREFMVQQCERYLTEPVDYQGKAKNKRDSFGWNAHSTRVVHMVHEHFDFHIKRALEDAVKDVNTKLAKGIQDTVRMKLAEITEGLKCEVKLK